MIKPRRKLFERSTADHPLTPLKLRVLAAVQTCHLAIPEQVADYCGISLKAARNHLADLYHRPLEAVDRIGVDRSALAGVDLLGDEQLLYGRAPTIYCVNKRGAKILIDLGMIRKEAFREPSDYGPGRDWGLAHEIQIRDFLVWFKRVHRAYPHHEGITTWKFGGDAWIDSGEVHVKPDGLLIYKFKTSEKPNKRTPGLVCFLEADRSTERSQDRIIEKFNQYKALFETDLIPKMTGYPVARVFFTVPNEARRNAVSSIIGGLMREYPTVRADRFWIIETPRLKEKEIDLTKAIWRVPGNPTKLPLVPPGVI